MNAEQVKQLHNTKYDCSTKSKYKPLTTKTPPGKELLSLSRINTIGSACTSKKGFKVDKDKHKKGFICSSISINNTTSGYNSKDQISSSNYQVETPINVHYKQYLVSKKLFSASMIPTNSSSIIASSSNPRDLFKKEISNRLFMETPSDIELNNFPSTARSLMKESVLSHTTAISKNKSKSKILNCKNTTRVEDSSLALVRNSKSTISNKFHKTMTSIKINKVFNSSKSKLKKAAHESFTRLQSTSRCITETKFNKNLAISPVSLSKSPDSRDVVNSNLNQQTKHLSKETLSARLKNLSDRHINLIDGYSNLIQTLIAGKNIKK